MFVATADQFAERVRQDFWWLRAAQWLIHPDREHERGWRLWVWLLWPLGFLGALIYAQALPYFLDHKLAPLLRELPQVTDRVLLGRIENLLSLCYELLRKVAPFSVRRGKTAHWLEELDEQLDSLEFVRMHGADVDSAVAQIRAHHTAHGSAS